MDSRLRFAIVGLGSLVGVGVLGGMAENSYLNAWKAKYPTSTLPTRIAAINGSQCYLCHHPTNMSNPGNCYKDAIATKLNSGQTIQQALASVETLDSDGDGVNNVTEILEPRIDQPGQVGYSPGLKGPTGTDPCWSNPNQAVTNQLETPPSCYPDCDGDANLTIDDFICFQTFFALSDPYADCDGDGVLTIDDFICFQTFFAIGC